jgi:hypothetical protein
MLGLNGLSRRKVRTGLTTATLVLITVAMICFTAGRSERREQATAIGPAPYQGLLINSEGQSPLAADEVSALRTQYGLNQPVVARTVWIGDEKWDTQERSNPRFSLSLGDQIAPLNSLIQWEAADPLAARVTLVAGALQLDAGKDRLPLAVSERTAEALGIVVKDLPKDGVELTLNGRAVVVTAIFQADSLEALRDLDGQQVLPFDIEAMAKLKRDKAGNIVARIDSPRISAAMVAIAPSGSLGLDVQFGFPRVVSAAVILDGVPYKEARAVISGHLERSGRSTAYGLDGTAWVGRMAEVSASGGAVELLVPLLIAALTVLNTMRGSVYERRTEIEVFNAVGIAPRYIAAMFFAEALVYAVVGAVLGYLLSLLLGRGLALAGWDAGLDLDVASLAPVWASLALAAAVFLSTWFPAQAAARIAAPADDAGWRLPVPDGDKLTIELPFAFDHRDRVGVLAFFARWFRDHGDGGAGSFQCAEPHLDVVGEPGAAVPRLACRMWLKPFDLGVAQDLTIELRPDPSGEFLAFLILERQTGTRESWLRLNQAFLTEARRHFLFWRAVDPGERGRLFTEGCTAVQGVPA